MKKSPLFSPDAAAGIETPELESDGPRPGAGARRRKHKQPEENKNHESNGTGPADIDAGCILSALVAFKSGDFSARLPLAWTGIAGKVADAFNEVAELMSR